MAVERGINLRSSATRGVTLAVTSAKMTATERTEAPRSAMETTSLETVGAAKAVVNAPKATAAAIARDLKENIFERMSVGEKRL